MEQLKLRICNWINSQVDALSTRKSDYCSEASAFSRARRLSFVRCISFLLSSPRKSLGIELCQFFDSIGASEDLCSPSAWTQARQKIFPQVLIDLNTHLCEEVSSWPELPHRHEGVFGRFELFGVDGTTLYLPQTERLVEEFGTQHSRGYPVAMARAVVCHHLIEQVCYKSYLGRIDVGEEAPLAQWIAQSRPDDLMIYDRGFASYLLFWHHQQAGSQLVVRMTKNFQVVTEFLHSDLEQAEVLIHPPRKNLRSSFEKWNIPFPESVAPILVRLIRVKLEGKEDEILATSLLDQQQFPIEAFADLYALRWKVETFYDRLKNQLGLELFSGHLPVVIKQDFFAAIITANLQEIFSSIAQIQYKDQHKTRKTNSRINRNIALGLIKLGLTGIFATQITTATIASCIEKMTRFTIPIRPGRSFPRTKRRKRVKGKFMYTQNFKQAV